MDTRDSVYSVHIDILNLITIMGDTIDIFNQLLEINLYEDIFSEVFTGTIRIQDNIGMFTKLPICGQEKLTLRFYSKSYDPTKNKKTDFIYRTFDIIKITDIIQENDYSFTYTLHFASPELKKNESIKISRSYSDTTISEVVANIMTSESDNSNGPPRGLDFPSTWISPSEASVKSDFLTANDIEANFVKSDDFDNVELFIEKTKFRDPYITIPYMKPFDVIRWLSSRAVRNCNGRGGWNGTNRESSNFLFFENKRGFQFTSIDTLLENKDNLNSVFHFGLGAQAKEVSGQRRNFLNTITSFQIQDCYNTIQNIRSGLYASRLYSYDIITGKLSERDFSMTEDFLTSETTERGTTSIRSPWQGVNDFPQFPIDSMGNSNVTQNFLAKQMMFSFSSSGEYDNITSEQTERYNINTQSGAYIQRRLSQLARWTNFRILANVPGNSVNKVGDVVVLDFKDLNYKDGYTDFDEVESKYYSGHYLITAIRHVITKTSYTQTIEFAKDSFKSVIGYTDDL